MPIVTHVNPQVRRRRLAGDIDRFDIGPLLDADRAGFRDREFQILDLFDGKRQAVRDRRYGETCDGHPFRLPRNAQLDRAEMLSARLDGVHASAFFAPASSSKMPKILTSPVMSKIFLICGFVQTRLTEPPCSRTRLRPPIKTPRPVESMYRTFSKLITR